MRNIMCWGVQHMCSKEWHHSVHMGSKESGQSMHVHTDSTYVCIYYTCLLKSHSAGFASKLGGRPNNEDISSTEYGSCAHLLA